MKKVANSAVCVVTLAMLLSVLMVARETSVFYVRMGSCEGPRES